MKFEPTGEDTGNYELPPEGEYHLEINATEAKVGKKPPNNGYINVTLMICDGPHKGSCLWDVWMMQGRGAHMGAKKAKQFGIDLSAGEEINISEWVGRKAYGYVHHEEYNGRVNPKIDARSLECGFRVDPDRNQIPF